ncbi:hypothetical protein FOCC_FOCC004046 [Frankliniella occidentalis]|nr:hypothetical protein FOCC_FOCC004046 [Frankliniella occidentalis]
MEILIRENEELKEKLVQAMSDHYRRTEGQAAPKLSAMLEILLESAKKNALKKTGGERYDEVIKELGALLFHVGGLQLYEILCNNLPLPSVSTIRRMIYNQECITEGVFRIKQLKTFLEQRNIPLKVHLSEDATVVAQRVQYHPASNQILGFSLPLDDNGLPVVGSFPATSANTISNYFKDNTISKNAYCVVAQPFVATAPSFIVAVYGTNNKFQAKDVHHRWIWICKEFEEEGIEVCGFSSDGDSRLLKCMVFNTITATPESNWKWCQARRVVHFTCVQDSIHIGTKLKSRLLKPSVILPAGSKFVVSSGHLVELIDKHMLKSHHLLSHTDINPKDKMNYEAMRRMSDKEVIKLLRLKVAGSEATALYLDMMREVVEAFASMELLPLARIEMIWKWVFYLRIWRDWVLKTDGYNLENNFITSNAYQCIEVNAHAIIQAVTMFRDCEDHKSFLPWLMSSQPCESTFRALRSAQVSFSILEMQNCIRRIDTMASSQLSLQEKIIFPRHHKAISKSAAMCHISVSLPEDFQIERAIVSAKNEAISYAINLGLMKKNQSASYFPLCQVHPISASDMEIFDDEINEDEDIPDEEEIMEVDVDQNIADTVDENDNEVPDILEDLYIVSSGSIGFKTFNNVNITETSPFVLVADGNGEPAVIRKSTLCWLLQSGDTKISADRLKRVQASTLKDPHRERREVSNPSKEDFICISDWCAFRSEDGSVAIGRILAFSYMSGSCKKNQQYSRLEAPIAAPENARGLGCLCSWYKLERSSLKPTNMDVHGYYDINNYICSIPRPKLVNHSLKLSWSMKAIRTFLS